MKRIFIYIILFLIFFFLESPAQQSINVESRWEYDFANSNQAHVIDTFTYDCETTYMVPWYSLVKDSVTCGVLRSPSGKQYYLYKYEVFFLDYLTEKSNGRR